MKKIYFFAILTVIGCSTHKGFYVGKYGIRHASYGRFATTIEFKADGTFVKNFYGDMMNDNSYGWWKLDGDTLRLAYDSLTYPKSRYKSNESYVVKGKRLTVNNVAFIKKLKQKGVWDSLSGSVRSFIRKNKTMVNFKGTIKPNYYRLLE